jgi:hypothetical protein
MAGRSSWSSAGALAAASWLRQRGIPTAPAMRWHVEIAMDTSDAPARPDYDDRRATRFHVDIYSEEWGVFFCHGGRASWIRVTDIPFVHGRDDFALLCVTPALKDIGGLLRLVEQRNVIRFQRHLALVRTNLVGAEPAIRRWLESL